METLNDDAIVLLWMRRVDWWLDDGGLLGLGGSLARLVCDRGCFRADREKDAGAPIIH